MGEKLLQNKIVVVSVLALLVGAGAGYALGQRAGYGKGDAAGYARAEVDAKKVQEAAARKATDDAARVANPFQVSNPLEGVEANPFERAKKVLNPFQ